MICKSLPNTFQNQLIHQKHFDMVDFTQINNFEVLSDLHKWIIKNSDKFDHDTSAYRYALTYAKKIIQEKEMEK